MSDGNKKKRAKWQVGKARVCREIGENKRILQNRLSNKPSFLPAQIDKIKRTRKFKLRITLQVEEINRLIGGQNEREREKRERDREKGERETERDYGQIP